MVGGVPPQPGSDFTGSDRENGPHQAGHFVSLSARQTCAFSAVARKLIVAQARFLKVGATVPKPERRGGEAMQARVEQEVVRRVEILKKVRLPER
jgi:hypothetical protein